MVSLLTQPCGKVLKKQPSTLRGRVELMKKDALGIGGTLRTIFGFSISQLDKECTKKLTIMWKCTKILGLGKYFVVFKPLNSGDIKCHIPSLTKIL